MQGGGPKRDDALQNAGKFLSVHLCGKIDPCALEEEMKGLRALGVRVLGLGRARTWDVHLDRWTDGRKFSPCFTGHHPLWGRLQKRKNKGGIEEKASDVRKQRETERVREGAF